MTRNSRAIGSRFPAAHPPAIVSLMELWWWGVVWLSIFLIGVTKSGFGSGFGLMVVPLIAIALGHIPSRGSEAALGLLLPLMLAGDVIAVWQDRE